MTDDLTVTDGTSRIAAHAAVLSETEFDALLDSFPRMTKYVDRNGQPIPTSRHFRLFDDQDYCQLRSTHLVYRRGGRQHRLRVSTVWTGFVAVGPFETMLFSASHELAPFDARQRRYNTEAQAREGHDLLVRALAEDLIPHTVRVFERVR